MNRLSKWLVLSILTVVFLLPVLAVAQTNGISDAEADFDTTEPVDSPFDAHQLMLEFVPGAVAPLHQHGGPGYITMLQGELTLSTDGDERVYQAGDSFVEVPESLYEGWNATDHTASLMVTYLVPEGHDVTTYTQPPGSRTGPAPTPITQTVFSAIQPPDGYTVSHKYLQLGPDEWVTVHDEDGLTFVTVVSGELTTEDTDGTQSTLAANDSFTDGLGAGHRLGNTGQEPVQVVVSQLLGDEEEGLWTRSSQIGVLLLAGAMGLVGGAFMLRRREKASI